jgi:sulfonate transport system permease protein
MTTTTGRQIENEATPAPPAPSLHPGEAAVPGLIRPVVEESRPRSRRASLALRSLLPLIIFALWWALTDSGVIGPTALASPGATWSAFVNLLVHQDLIGDIGVSARRAGFGLLLGGGLGLIIGITVGLFALGEELFDSTMQMVRTVPYPVLIFPFIIWFGIGETAKVLLIAYATMIPMYIFTFNGVRNVDRRVVEAARSFGLRGQRLVRKVVIPLALPSILNGLRLSAGISVVALVFVETINANQGIGYLVSQASSLQQVPNLVVCIFIYAILGILADVLVRLIERLSMPWRRHLAVR